jgi:UDP-N-acetylmuramyl tripeptide synthase
MPTFLVMVGFGDMLRNMNFHSAHMDAESAAAAAVAANKRLQNSIEEIRHVVIQVNGATGRISRVQINREA